MAERTVTAALVIRAMCRELYMDEETLLVHLAMNSIDSVLPPSWQADILAEAQAYHNAGVYMLESL